MILGLDVSTSCTGWCLIEENSKLIDIGFISLEKHKGIYSKAKIVEKALQNILISHSVEKVFIEENLQAFRPGLSSAKTLSTLARFNGIVSLLCYQVFEIEPIHVNVNAARKSLGIKIERQSKCGKSTKEQVVEWASGELKDFLWPTKVLKSGKRKGLEMLDPASFDMADAYVISRAGVVLEQ